MHRRIYFAVFVVLSLLSALTGILSNIVSSLLPIGWRSFLWLAWPLLIFFVIACIGLSIWQVYLEKKFSSSDKSNTLMTLSTSLKDHTTEANQGINRQPNLSINDIVQPPHPYIAHIYTLMQTRAVIGRREELKRLTDWVSNKQSPDYNECIFLIVALGGMGKSALAWYWFNRIAPEKMNSLAGLIWWNFYIDSDFELFLRKTLAYVSRQEKQQIYALSRSECEEKLINIFRAEPYLLVLDGLERIMDAYPHVDVEELSDGNSGQEARYQMTESRILKYINTQRALRQITDPRTELFLQQLAQMPKTRTLISTRLVPSALQTDTDDLMPGCTAMNLSGLDDDDALELWRTLGVTGSSSVLLDTFRPFNNYPLLIKVLARLVACDREAPGDFDRWRVKNAHFDFAKLPLATVKQHVLAVAIEALDETAKGVLHVIAAASTPIVYDTLVVLLVGGDKLCKDKNELDDKLKELEDRGLMGWDRKENRYDLHPIVRSIASAMPDLDAKRRIYKTLYAHFAYVPKIDLNKAQSWNDLVPDIEMYNALIALGQYEEALSIFQMRLEKVLIDHLSDTARAIDLLRVLFPKADETESPVLKERSDQAYTLDALARAYQFSEQPGRAVPLHDRAMKIFEVLNISDMLESTRVLLADALHAAGKLYDSESITRSLAIDPSTQEYSRAWLWIQFLLMTRGERRYLNMTFLRQLASKPWRKVQPSANNIALGMLRLNEYDLAFSLAIKAEEQARNAHFTRDFIRATRLKGAIYLKKNNLARAEQCLLSALEQAKKANYAEGKLPALIGLTELEGKRGNFKRAREYLKRVWRPAQSGPYPLIQADAKNMLAQIERDEGNKDAAIEAAREAYILAWCDGPPFVYRQGLDNALVHLRALNAKIPSLTTAVYPSILDGKLPLPDDLIY